MANRFVFPIEQRFDGNGNPLSGGKLYFYENGTSTPKDTYADADLTTPNANPVVADSDGVWPDIFLDGVYTVKLTDSDDVQRFSKDDVEGPIFTAIGSGAGDVPTNAFVGSFVPSIADGGTDTYEADFGRDVSAGETVRGDFGSANTTTTPTLENTGGTPAAQTITTKDGSALWAGALSGVHTLQLASGGGSWLVLDPRPLDGDQPASVSYVDAALIAIDPATATDGGTDAYQASLGVSLSAGETFLAEPDSKNTTESPELENTDGSPSGAQSVVTVNGNAWPGMLQPRAHRFLWDGTNYVVQDPQTVIHKETVDATNGGSDDLSEVAFESLGSGAFRITMPVGRLSTSGTNDLFVQIGDSGGYETSGYTSTGVQNTDGSSPSIQSFSSAFGINIDAAASDMCGAVTVSLVDEDADQWESQYNLVGETSTPRHLHGAGFKSLSGGVDRIRITTSNTDTFDGGVIGLTVEYLP